ncbi:HNH endonuclease [Flavobacterium psychrophilum]|uniref:HNH endonuclease n=1 Tax=Flavobacterium psychrophilum TaxID=96345 RepID=UPI002A47835C|nr:HNH endonuclease [Flavobacterium psychrophilum]EKT4517935.1 HNH endonuclease [Flavobacterium psychrophilum]
MAKIDRNSYQDAKKTFEKLLPDNETRQKVVDFLATSIGYADTLNSEKWNINLDLNGHFIRFNVGHEYCIEIIDQRILILCDRITLKPILENVSVPVIFRGHIGREIYQSIIIEEVPDCLAKTKNSIGCIIKTSDIKNHIDLFSNSNLDFIKSAIKTHQLPQMRQSHSKGVIEYLAQELDKNIDNPIYEKTNLPTLTQVLEYEERKISKAKRLSRQKRRELLAKSDPKPTKTVVSQVVFNRNQYVIAEVLDRANGICEKCQRPAPFNKDKDGLPYLEVHHKIPLAENGDDTVNNAIGLCPNCHRQAHYGKTTY